MKKQTDSSSAPAPACWQELTFSRFYPGLCLAWCLGLLLCLVLSAFSLATAVMWLMYIGTGVKLAALFTLFLLFYLSSRRQSVQDVFFPDRFMFVCVGFVVLASVFRMGLKNACYGGLNTFGSACFLGVLGFRLSFVTRRRVFAELVPLQRWITFLAVLSAAALTLMLFALAVFDVSFMQTVFSVCFYGSQSLEFLTLALCALFFFTCNRTLKNCRYADLTSEA